jgi:hypothetical protein
LPPVLPEPTPPGPEFAELFPPLFAPAPAPVDDVPVPAGEPVDDVVEPSPAAATPKAPALTEAPPCDVQPGPPPDGHPPCALVSASTIIPEFVAGTAFPVFVLAPAIAA